MSILVLGSFMMDQVVSTPRAPRNGETIIGTNYNMYPGGKGANQAVSIARLGGRVRMAGKLGNDSSGNIFINTLKREGVDTKYIEIDENYPTGVGFVTSEKNGDNRIIVVPGANLKYSTKELSNLNEIFDNIEILIIQLEMDIDVMTEAVKMAKNKGVKVILNPAPGRPLSDSFLKDINILTPNEGELEILTGIKVNSLREIKEAALTLLEKKIETIIVTLGSKGALLVTNDTEELIEGFDVNVKDTVAAGDAFNGALAVAISEGKNMIEAVRIANATGALTVQTSGAIPSIPKRQEVELFISQYTD